MARRRKSPQTSTLPASLILTSREEKYFRRYQRTNVTVSAERQGLLPTAAEYLAFQCWYKQRDSGYFSDTSLGTLATYLEKKDRERNAAKLCNHPLHPSHGAQHTSCPPCIVEMYMRYVDLLRENLTNCDGTVQQRWEPTYDDPIVMAWRTGKVHLLRAVATIEKWAVSEHDWEQRHAEASVDNTKTAKQALQMYHAAIENSCAVSTQSVGSETSSASCMSSTSLLGSAGAKPRRSVSFVEDTSFTLGRPPQYFCRKSPRYEAGKYAVAVEWDCKDESEDGTVEKDGNDADSEDDDSEEDEDEDEDEPIAMTANTPIATNEGNGSNEKNAPVHKVILIKNDSVRKGDKADASEQSDGSEEADSDAASESDCYSEEQDSDEDDGEDEEDADETDPIVLEETSFVVFAN